MSNFERLYEYYLEKAEKNLFDLGFSEADVCELADDDVLKSFAKAITAQCFRNGLIEDLHSEIPALTDEIMKKLNKDVCNRVYTFLLLCLNTDDVSAMQLLFTMSFGNMCTSSWDNPEIIDDLLVDMNEIMASEISSELNY